MKWFLYIIALVLMLAGGGFALQGLRLLPSRIMYGRPEWVVIGAALVIVGIALVAFDLVYSRRAATQ